MHFAPALPYQCPSNLLLLMLPLPNLPPPQTFQDDLLQLCGRAHDAADVYRAIEAVHAAGVPSWSLDLMSGLPQVRLQPASCCHRLLPVVAVPGSTCQCLPASRQQRDLHERLQADWLSA
jgi:hypothetical protein